MAISTDTSLDRENDNDEEDDDDPDDKDRKHLLALFLLLLTTTRNEFTAHISAYLAGTITLAGLSDALVGVLQNSHTDAVALGRQLAGVGGSDVTEADTAFADVIVAGQETFLAGLLRDLESGRYTTQAVSDAITDMGPAEGLISGALAARIDLWARRLRGSSNASWIMAQPEGTLVDWITTANESCDGCLGMEGDNPHVSDQMEAFPSDGLQPCGVNCKCFLSLASGEEGMPFMDFGDEG